jgi:iterative type I PKS product template protein
MIPDIPVSRLPKCSTTTCQRLIYENVDHALGSGTLVFQSDISHPKVFPAVTGHVVNHVPLLPSAIYADMAMTAADFLYRTLRPSASDIGLNVCAMEVHKPVIAKIPPPEDGQHIQMEAHADLRKMEVSLVFRSVTWDGKFMENHGHGMVKYEDPAEWISEWQRTQYLVETQIALLEDRLSVGLAHKFLTGLAYKLFQSLVHYTPKYQGMQEVILDSEDTAATAKIRFQTTDADGDYFCSPYFIDNLCHLSGFIANASDISNSDMTYISHGWRSFKVPNPKAISADKEYRCYVRMIAQPGNVTAGDVYVFESGDVIAVFYGCKFQGIPKRAMDVLLSPSVKGRGTRNTVQKCRD